MHTRYFQVGGVFEDIPEGFADAGTTAWAAQAQGSCGRSHPGPGFRLNWLSRLVDVCLRSEVKRMLGWAGSAP